ncbi:hypothetical protein SUGI_1083330 [Cryptomeria japonica]|nr:hypothetical protein SUGI_1083330 [Cryptomeria japonica]
MFLAKKTLLNLVAAAPMNTRLCCKLTVLHPFHFGIVFSAPVNENAHLQSLFADFASTKFNMSAADITQILETFPVLGRLKTLQNVEQFIHMLNKRGCTEVQIAKIIRLQPSLMLTNTERVLEPKIKLLEDIGIQGQNLVKILTTDPRILTTSLENDLIPKMEFLKNVFQSQDLLVRSLVRVPLILRNNLEETLKPSVALWQRWGFRGVELTKFLGMRPQVLFHTSLTPAQIDLIDKICPEKTRKMYKYIVSIVAVSRLETLQAKIDNLKLCGGASSEEIWQLISAAPQVLLCSEENVSDKMNFLVNNMEFPANYVVKHAWLLCISLERKLRPRFLVLQKIKSINELDLSLLTVLKMPEAMFVNKFIKRSNVDILSAKHSESNCFSSKHKNTGELQQTDM